MKPQQKTETRLQFATRAVIAALEAHNERNPGQCIVKAKLLPLASRRANWIMEDIDDPTLIDEAIGIPSINFIRSRWSEICLRAAQKHHKYIVWEPRIGIRLGTFEEYQDIPNQTLANICQGLVDNVEDRTKIIINQGGQSFLMSIHIKQLGDGRPKNV